MRTSLTLIHLNGVLLDTPIIYDLDLIAEQGPDNARKSLKLIREGGVIVTTEPEKGAEVAATLSWNRKYSTWDLVNDGSAGSVFVNGVPLQPGQRRPLSFASDSDARIQLGGFVGKGSGDLLHLKRVPSPPVYLGKEVEEVPIVETRLLIGRGVKPKDESDALKPRLCLDDEIYAISSRQAEVCREGDSFYVRNHNQGGKFRTVLNGNQNFDEHRLVFGDCIQIPEYPYYTFQFNGKGLVHVGANEGLTARDLSKDIGAFKILTDVSIDLKGGDFVGILGGSGQGKSTLLNAISGISPATSGGVWLDQRRLCGAADMALAGIGYVPQEDIVHRELTVEEALLFTGRLRLDLPEVLLKEAVLSVLKTLGLASEDSAEKDRRGTQISKLSGGQRKRVSVACELLTNPRSLLLDEPTSGLDPQTESELMGELSLLALKKRMGIMCTTHVLQNSHVFSSLGFIQGGRLIFSGRPIDAARFFLLSRPYADDNENGGEYTAAASMVSNDDVHDIDLLDKLPKTYEKISEGATRLDSEEMERRFVESEFYTAPTAVETSQGKAESDNQKQKKSSAPPATLFLKRFTVLCTRQWRILLADRLNLLFLLAQALIIGSLVGWVSGNLVFQMFLAVIATLWFGCSNGAQQIVGEVAIFRRERLSGLGLNVYIASKVAFLSLVTVIQSLILYGAVLCSSHLFHSDLVNEFVDPELSAFAQDRQIFSDMFFGSMPDATGEETSSDGAIKPVDDGLDDLFGGGGIYLDGAAVGDAVTEGDVRVVFESGMEQPVEEQITVLYDNPANLSPDTLSFRMFADLSWFFRIRVNALDHLGVEKVELGGQNAEDSLLRDRRHWFGLITLHVILRVTGLVAAAVLGVFLGLTVSALVGTPTQAVMWVPLILIPQILFGGFVVTGPEMSGSVYASSRLLPSFNVQQLMDVANLYGRKAPRMTNKTRMPAFLEVPPYEQETVAFYDRNGLKLSEKYDAVSAVNKSWQNRIVDRFIVGGRLKVSDRRSQGQPDTITERRDVLLKTGAPYRYLGGLYQSLSILFGWCIVCYGMTLYGLVRKQSGK